MITSMITSGIASSCIKAYDGLLGEGREWLTKSENVGSWIKLDFARHVSVNTMKYANRASLARNKLVRLEFSDSKDTHETVVLKNDAILHSYALQKTHLTTFVKIIVLSSYHFSDNGAAEIEFWGSGFPTSLRPIGIMTSAEARRISQEARQLLKLRENVSMGPDLLLPDADALASPLLWWEVSLEEMDTYRSIQMEGDSAPSAF